MSREEDWLAPDHIARGRARIKIRAFAPAALYREPRQSDGRDRTAFCSHPGYWTRAPVSGSCLSILGRAAVDHRSAWARLITLIIAKIY